MRIGIPTEVKNREYRVAITPAGVHELVGHGHQVLVQRGAGAGSSITDEEYAAVGARIVPSAEDVWADGELILKVKEPIEQEYGLIRSGQVLFTYLHLAASRPCTDALISAGATAIAYETVQLPDRSLPLLAPMSEVAGRLAPQVGAYHLMRGRAGSDSATSRGVLMGGVSGVRAARVVVIGAGVSGQNAASIALGMQADVILMDNNVDKLRHADQLYRGHLQTVMSNAWEIRQAVRDADLIIGAVLVAGAKAPTLIGHDLVGDLKPGSVLVDIAIDQDGCFADSRPTTHDDPVFTVGSSIFYCVANMPGAVPNTSTHALTNVTVPYAVALADRGWREACRADPALALGLNVHGGEVINGPVAAAHGLPYRSAAEVLG